MIRIHAIALSVGIVAVMTFPLWAADKLKEEGKPESKIPLTITVKEAESKPSVGKLQFVAEVVNKSDQSIKLATNGKTPPFTVQIFNSQGNIVNKEILKLVSSGEPGGEILFAPKEKKVFPLTYDGPKEGVDAGKPLPAGTYKVTAILPVTSYIEGQKTVNLGLPVLLKSQEVELTVPKEQK